MNLISDNMAKNSSLLTLWPFPVRVKSEHELNLKLFQLKSCLNMHMQLQGCLYVNNYFQYVGYLNIFQGDNKMLNDNMIYNLLMQESQS